MNLEQTKQLRATLLTSTEGRILLLGVGVAFTYALWLGLKVLLSPQDGQVLVGVTATASLFGRAAGMAFGYSLGLSRIEVILIAIVVETVFVLICYPLFVLSWRHLLVTRGLKKTFERMHEAAEKHRGKIQRYGIIGLFAFVWFPFWMTGPVVGSVIGFLIGLRPWVTVAVVLGGTYTAIVSWAFFMHRLTGQAAAYSSDAPMILVALLILIVVVGHFLLRTLHENKNKSGQ